jgi:hypothetical protein
MLSFPCIVACARGTWMEKVLPCPGTLSTGRVPLVLNNDALRDCQAKSTAIVVAGVGAIGPVEAFARHAAAPPARCQCRYR